MSRRAAAVARKLGATLINYTDPGCACGGGCRDDCPKLRRHWFEGPNRGAPFDGQLAREVCAALEAAGIKAKAGAP